MLLYGIINELDKPIVKTVPLSYFFYQANNSRINSATAILQGLLYMLVVQQPSLVSHIQKKYDHSGKTLFKDTNAWVALSEIFTDILQDPSLDGAYLIVDRLDECVTDLPKLLDLIVQTSSISFHIKWIVSSHNWPDISERLVNAGQNLSLKLNAESVSAAVIIFIRHKDTMTGATLQMLKGYSDSIFSVAFSPNGKQVVSGSYNGIVQLWDATTGAALQTLKGHSGWVNSVAFSPDSKQVVSGSYDGTVRLWDATTGAALQTLKGHSDSLYSVAFLLDGKQVVSGSSNETVRLWDAMTGATLQTLEGHSRAANSVIFSSDGNLLPTLRVSNYWVVEGKENILWLPPDYRSACEAFWDKPVILGHSSGRLSFFQFRQGPKFVV